VKEDEPKMDKGSHSGAKLVAVCRKVCMGLVSLARKLLGILKCSLEAVLIILGIPVLSVLIGITPWFLLPFLIMIGIQVGSPANWFIWGGWLVLFFTCSILAAVVNYIREGKGGEEPKKRATEAMLEYG